MKQKDQLYTSFGEFINPTIRPHESGVLGNYNGVVDVPNRINYVYVRLSSGTMVEAFNNLVPSLLNLNVLVGTNPQRTTELKVLDVLLDMHPDGIGVPSIQKHGPSHEWPASDTVYISYRQLLPLRPNVESGLEVSINPGWYINNDSKVKYFAGTSANINMSSYLPSTGARWALITFDSSGTIDVITDGTGTGYLDLTTLNIPAIPENEIAIAAIKCRAGQTTIKDNALSSTELLDLRFAIKPTGGTWGSITGTLSDQTDLQSALDGKQPIDSDLTAIAALSPSNDDIIQRKAGAWVNRTMAQLADDVSPHIAYLRPQSSANNLYRCDAPGGTSSWSGTISSKSGADVVYSTTSGTPGALVPQSTSNIAKIILHNTTRGTYALISNCNTDTNTITLTATVPTDWLATDVITINSQTITGAPIQYVDIKIASEFTGAIALLIAMNIISATAGNNMRVHPLETYGTGKQQTAQAIVAGMNGTNTAFVTISNDIFCLGWTGTPSNVILTVIGESK